MVVCIIKGLIKKKKRWEASLRLEICSVWLGKAWVTGVSLNPSSGSLRIFQSSFLCFTGLCGKGPGDHLVQLPVPGILDKWQSDLRLGDHQWEWVPRAGQTEVLSALSWSQGFSICYISRSLQELFEAWTLLIYPEVEMGFELWCSALQWVSQRSLVL